MVGDRKGKEKDGRKKERKEKDGRGEKAPLPRNKNSDYGLENHVFSVAATHAWNSVQSAPSDEGLLT